MEPRRGAAAVEFAAVLPLLMLFLFGAVDFGRYSHTWISVTNSARSGAAFGANNPFTEASRTAWESGIREAVRRDLESMGGFDGGRLKVEITPGVDTENRRRVSVAVEYPFDSLVVWMKLPGSLPVRQTAVFPMIR